MTILIATRFDKCFLDHGTPAGTTAVPDVTTSQEPANLASLWARGEPALVAQHHREWLLWQLSPDGSAAPVARRSESEGWIRSRW
jgi:hypothetical protein